MDEIVFSKMGFDAYELNAHPSIHIHFYHGAVRAHLMRMAGFEFKQGGKKL